jgi:hypothetical protein
MENISIANKEIIDGIIESMKKEGAVETLEKFTKNFAEKVVSLSDEDFKLSLKYFRTQLTENFKDLNEKKTNENHENQLDNKNVITMAKVIKNITNSNDKTNIVISVLTGYDDIYVKYKEQTQPKKEYPHVIINEKKIKISDEILEIVNYGLSLISKENPRINIDESFKKIGILANVLEIEDYKVCVKHLMKELYKFPGLTNRHDSLGDILKDTVKESMITSMSFQLHNKEKKEILINTVTENDKFQNKTIELENYSRKVKVHQPRNKMFRKN